MQKLTKILKWVISVIVILVLLTGASGYLYLRNSLPQTSGTVSVAGLKAPVEIIRDTNDVPHIYAKDKLDAYFGLGYVHAQDRLWEMEIWRRITQGRFSEIFGEEAVGGDRYLRALGLLRAGKSAWEHLSPDTKDMVNAYTAGVNAYLNSHSGSQLPTEFTIFSIVPELWTSVDSVAWSKIFALDLSSNSGMEIFRQDLIEKLGAERAKQLLPSYLKTGPVIAPSLTKTAAENDQVSAYARVAALQSLVQTLSGIGGPQTGAKGSNSWVIDGTKSVTGKPILANDPHLTMTLPGWYMAHLSAGEFDVQGATIPGLPGVVIGHNRSIAWGFTGLNPDVQDFYMERIDETGTMAEFKGKMEPMTIIDETIKVLGKPDVKFKLRITRHGPLMTDAFNANDLESTIPVYLRRAAPLQPMALRWSALDDADTTVEAFLGLNEAQNWEEVKKTMSKMVAPGLSFVYADTSGNIGYYAVAGRVPIRAKGDGSVPVEGWTGENEWIGWVPFEEMPHAYNPPEHFIVTANNKPTADDYPHFLGNEWYPYYRAQRITDLINAKDKLSLDDMGAIQGDQVSLQAKELLPLLLAVATPQTDSEKRAIELLKAWDGNATKDSVAAAIYGSWFSHLPRAIAGDELGRSLSANYQGNFTFTSRFLAETLKDPKNIWCDNTTTPAVEDCAATVTQTLRETLVELNTKLGSDMSTWQWGRLHTSVIFHVPFFSVPALLPIFSRSAPSGGDWSTVNMGAYGAAPYSLPSDDIFYTHSFGPSYRGLVDLSNFENSRFIETIGQSGHFLSPRYDIFFADWQAIRYRPLPFSRESVDKMKDATLILQPKAP